jgi:predicted negative regulator of RcsB-dependent stress response
MHAAKDVYKVTESAANQKALFCAMIAVNFVFNWTNFEKETEPSHAQAATRNNSPQRVETSLQNKKSVVSHDCTLTTFL